MVEIKFEQFVLAQNPVIEPAKADLANGKIRSRWLEFIFPQLAGWQRDLNGQCPALQSLHEARLYADHPVLGERLRLCTRLVVDFKGRGVADAIDQRDASKLQSSMTLFALAASEEPLFEAVLKKNFAGKADLRTLELLWEREGTQPPLWLSAKV